MQGRHHTSAALKWNTQASSACIAAVSAGAAVSVRRTRGPKRSG